MFLSCYIFIFVVGIAASGSDSNANDVYTQCIANQDNRTALGLLQAPGWVDSPQIRGTSSILWSSILTIVACVYTALHLNVPRQKTFWRRLAVKAKWVLTALLAPEVMIYVSAKQFWSAWSLRKELRELLKGIGESEETTSDKWESLPEESSIDLRLCFFIEMGGVQVEVAADAINLSDEPGSIEKDEKIMMTVGGYGVCQLLKMGYWIPITSHIINDKSKANLFQKSLVLLQVGWFAIQCVGRLIYALPISLLEIHTVVHVVAAAIMYFFWFKKPLDIMEPEVLDGNASHLLSIMHNWRRLSDDIHSRSQQLIFYGALTDDGGGAIATRSIEHTHSDTRPQPIEYIRPLAGSNNTLRVGQALTCGIGVSSDQVVLLDKDMVCLERMANQITKLQPVPYQRHLSDILAGIDEYSGSALLLTAPERNLYIDGDASGVGVVAMNMSEKTSRIDMVTDMERGVAGAKTFRKRFTETADEQFHQIIIGMRFFVDLFGMDTRYSIGSGRILDALLGIMFPVLYGGIHLLAWNSFFPTIIEHTMWKSACFIIIGAIPVLWVIASALIHLDELEDLVRESTLAENAVLISTVFLLVLFYIIPIFTIAARFFVIIEAFISLRSAPIGIFWTPSWIQMLPHV